MVEKVEDIILTKEEKKRRNDLIKNAIEEYKKGFTPSASLNVPTAADIPTKNIRLFTMFGTSGAGKGTRAYHFVNWLINECELDYEFIINKEEKTNKPLGIVFPEISLVIFGHLVKSQSSVLISWNSYDSIQNIVRKKGKNILDLIHELHTDYNYNNFLFEGYVNMAYSEKIITMSEGKNFKYPIYIYEDYFVYEGTKEETFEMIQERIVGRNGKRIKGSCHPDNITIPRWSKRMTQGLGETDHHSHTDPQYIMTQKYKEILGIKVGNEIDEKYSVLRNINHFEESTNNYIDLYCEQEYKKENNANFIF